MLTFEIFDAASFFGQFFIFIFKKNSFQICRGVRHESSPAQYSEGYDSSQESGKI